MVFPSQGNCSADVSLFLRGANGLETIFLNASGCLVPHSQQALLSLSQFLAYLALLDTACYFLNSLLKALLPAKAQRRLWAALLHLTEEQRLAKMLHVKLGINGKAGHQRAESSWFFWHRDGQKQSLWTKTHTSHHRSALTSPCSCRGTNTETYTLITPDISQGSEHPER